MHQSLQGATFHIEQIIPISKGGESTLLNLALACPSCNLHKADRIEASDPETGLSVPLFNPRLSQWEQHFSFRGYNMIGLTPIGRAAINLLHLNTTRRIRIRKAEAGFDLFPLLGR